MNKYSLLWLLLLWPGLLLAQLNITSPQSRIVYQRNQANQASVTVTGVAPQNASRVEARLVSISGGSTTGWSSIAIISSNKGFRGALTGTGGWYRLEVRAWSDADIAAEGSIDRVGIGEVFVVAGQSNAMGIQEAGGASDDRVSVIDFRDNDVNEQLLPVRFNHADGGGNVGPSNPLYIWGKLGDQLANRLQVPVLFLGAAQPGTSSEEWRRSAESDASLSASLFPYRRLGAVLLHYVARTGARAVLWHQGEGDIDRGQQQYFDNLSYIISRSRQQANFGALAWVVCRVSYIQGRTNGGIINAQNQLIGTVPNVFAGPNTDVLTGTDNRFDDVHFGGAGLSRLVDLWNQSLSADFFNRSLPASPSGDTPAITTGYVLPNTAAPGGQVWVPYVQSGPFGSGNQFKAQLLTADGGVITESAPSNQNPLPLSIPGGLSAGTYRTRVVSTQPSLVGASGESFRVVPGASGGSGTTPVQPTVTGGTPDASITRIGYSYDAPSHGFNILVNATGPVEVRLERIDGGGFGETNWGGASDNNSNPGFNKARYYAPASVGVGGVEPGRYRISVRRAGDGGAGIWVEVNLFNGRTTVYTSSDTTTPVTTTPPTTPTTPPVEPPTTPTSPAAYISQLGYKYDMPTHGFQLLVTAQGPVEVKLDRLDGAFSETNWSSTSVTGEFGTFNFFRFYAPLSMGVGGVEPGRYRLSARQAGTSSAGQSIEVTLQNGMVQLGGVVNNPPTTTTPTNPTPPTTTNPPTTSTGTTNPAAGQLRRIGYKYDMPTHGFQLLTEATGAVEVRLERLDGSFGPSNWGAVTASGEFSGYNGFRFFAPVAMGVGGVEPGRYRLSVRLVGDTGNGQAAEVTLGNGSFEVWTGSAGGSTTPTTTPPTTTTPPSTTPPTTSTPTTTQGLIQAIGYKYDMPTHGFQLLAKATVAVEMRLERLDGSFAESNWGAASSSSEYPGYNGFRFYAPIRMGVGGVEPGRYRLSVRKTGDSGSGQSLEITLQNGTFQVAAPNARVASTGSPEEIIWQAYPNPADTEITVTYPANLPMSNVQTQLTTLAGIAMNVPAQVVRPGQLRVSLGDAPVGLYLLRILDGNQSVQVLKVLKR